MIDAAVHIHVQKLRYPFGISRNTVSELPTIMLRLGEHGHGEGSPVRYLGQTAPEGARLLADYCARHLREDNLTDIAGHAARAASEMPGHSAARCALDLALWDIAGRRVEKSIWQLINAPDPRGLQTSYTIALADNNDMVARAFEAAHMPVLKVKLGRDIDLDLAVMQRIRRALPETALRVDANAGYSFDAAMQIIPGLADLGVELVEQPLAIGAIEETRRLRAESPLPIFVDEDVQTIDDLPRLRGACDGINIKIAKCGGISGALPMIRFAREEGWRVFLGCMIETRLALCAAAQLAGLVDFLDLDGHLLTTNDPFPGGSVAPPRPAIPLGEGPGLGLPLIPLPDSNS